MKALIADDEPVLARHLRARLGELWPELEVVGMAANGIEALEMIEGLKPDVAFLDIRMPGLSGLDVARAASGRCDPAHDPGNPRRGSATRRGHPRLAWMPGEVYKPAVLSGGDWRNAFWPLREKSMDSPRIRAASCGAWKPVEFSASTKSR